MAQLTEIVVANATMQHCHLSYRRREDMRPDAQPKTLEIPMGGQAKFPGYFDSEGVKFIIVQLERRGAVPSNDLNAITRPQALIYSVQDVIEKETIEQGIELDLQAREDVAAQQMEKSGVQAFTAAQQALRASGAGVIAEKLRESTMAITEVTDSETVTGGADMEVTVSSKPGVAGRLERKDRTSRKKR